MKYSKVSRRISRDEKFRQLSPPKPNGQSAFMHVLTNPHLTSIPGLFSAYDATLAMDLGWQTVAFRDAIAEAIALGMLEVDWAAPLLWVPNAFNHNKPESLNVVKSWRPVYDDLPDCALKLKALRELDVYMLGIGDAFLDTFRFAFRDVLSKARAIQEQEPEQEQEQEPKNDTSSSPPPPAPKAPRATQVVFDAWRAATGRQRAKLDGKRERLIRARLKDFTLEDLCEAVTNVSNSPFHMGENEKRTKYNDLELILRDSAHVEKFLAMKTQQPTSNSVINGKIPFQDWGNADDEKYRHQGDA